MKKAIAVRHLSFENLGNLTDELNYYGYECSYLDAGKDDISVLDQDVDLLIILGAPVGANDIDKYPFLEDEIKAVKNRFESNQPTLGICLGAQIMANCAGGKVFSGDQKEIGWYKVEASKGNELFSIIDNIHVLHWHGDSFVLPANATLCASSAIYKNQAFMIGDKFLGIQFHLEFSSNYSSIEQWLIGHAAELFAAGIDINKVRGDTERYQDDLAKKASLFWSTWLEMIN